ncbi:type I-F CRISPR-associated protein Csy1 [Vibrio harveyi]|uniref:type I-F CRISPR-associated protein Csy1 n=1 Tax=Vibrio harveyi TaxID=669 RepID=UPI003CE78F9E
MFHFGEVNELLDEIYGKKEVLEPKKIVDELDFIQPLGKSSETDFVYVQGVEQLKQLILLAFNLSFTPKGVELKKDDLMSSLTLKGKVEAGSKQEDVFLKMFDAVTTHPVKNGDIKNFIENIFSLGTGDTMHGITSASCKPQKRLACSANAALLGYKHLFVLEFIYNGKQTSFIELLSEKNEAVIEVLANSLSLPDELICASVEKSQQLVGSYFGDAIQSKQMFWPIIDDEGDVTYEIITPVPSAKLIRGVRRETQAFMRENETRWVSKRQQLIGGTQPQNISDLNSKIVGRNDLLFADLSMLQNQSSVIEKRLKSGKSLLNNARIEDCKILKTEKLHFKQKPSYIRAVKDVAYRMIGNLLTYKDNLEQYEQSNYELASLDDKLFVHGLNGRSNCEDYAKTLNAKMIQGFRSANVSPDEGTMVLIRQVLLEVVLECA